MLGDHQKKKRIGVVFLELPQTIYHRKAVNLISSTFHDNNKDQLGWKSEVIWEPKLRNTSCSNKYNANEVFGIRTPRWSRYTQKFRALLRRPTVLLSFILKKPFLSKWLERVNFKILLSFLENARFSQPFCWFVAETKFTNVALSRYCLTWLKSKKNYMCTYHKVLLTYPGGRQTTLLIANRHSLTASRLAIWYDCNLLFKLRKIMQNCLVTCLPTSSGVQDAKKVNSLTFNCISL